MSYVSLSAYVEAVKGGRIVALPTDTVWGLAASLSTVPAYMS